MNGVGRRRLAGVMLLLLVQAALAVFLGFVATIHWEEVRRFGQYLYPPYTPDQQTATRVTLEKVGAALAVSVACAFVAVLVAMICSLKSRGLALRAHLVFGRMCLITAGATFLTALGVRPLYGGHTDMGAGLAHYISAATMLLISGAAFGIARLLRTPTTGIPTGQPVEQQNSQ